MKQPTPQPFNLPEDRARAQAILDALPKKKIRRITTETLGGKFRHMDASVRRRKKKEEVDGE